MVNMLQCLYRQQIRSKNDGRINTIFICIEIEHHKPGMLRDKTSFCSFDNQPVLYQKYGLNAITTKTWARICSGSNKIL